MTERGKKYLKRPEQHRWNLSRRSILIGLVGIATTGCMTSPPNAIAQSPSLQGASAKTLLSKSSIHEFPHPAVVVHYHPTPDYMDQFTLDEVTFALSKKVHAIELDLHYRQKDQQVVCNHNGPTDASPTLEQVIQLVLAQKGTSPTVNQDDHQFFLVLEPKDNDHLLFDGIFQVLTSHQIQWSTAVGATDGPRGITIVITGAYVGQFYDYFANAGKRYQLNQLCIVEGHNYSQEIINLSPQQTPFQWCGAIAHPAEQRLVNVLHAGKTNVRTWNGHGDMVICLAAGADEINADHNEIDTLKQLILHQNPRGSFPSLAIQGTQAVLAWQGVSSNNLYVAVGTLEPSGLIFQRQILLTYLLQDQPLAVAPSVTFTNNGQFVVAYQGTNANRLWYVSGKFSSPVRFVTFEGREHSLTLPNDAGRLGNSPSIAVGPDGRVIYVYQGTADQKLWYVSGYLNADGGLVGQEFSLTEGNARRGSTPSVSIDSNGRVIVIYQGTSNQKLWYVSGHLGADGRIIGNEFSLTEGDTRLGSRPSVAIDKNGRVIVAYEGTDGQKLWYVSGSLDSSGRIVGQEFSLTENNTRQGHRPTVAFDTTGQAVIFYEGTSEGKLWYVQGRIDATGRLVGEERLLDIGMSEL